MEGTDSVGSVFVVDAHPIYRRGLVACLSALDEVTSVGDAADVDLARSDPRLHGADLLVIDHELDGSHELIGELSGSAAPRAIVCSACQTDDRVRASIRAGAIGFLSKETLRPETLLVGLLAATNGAGILAPGMLGALMAEAVDAPPLVALPTPAVIAELTSQLTTREHDVLVLIADGEPTREVARQLSYSERTVKNVLHDVAVKLGARSRSHAVAHAVRQGLI